MLVSVQSVEECWLNGEESMGSSGAVLTILDADIQSLERIGVDRAIASPYLLTLLAIFHKNYCFLEIFCLPLQLETLKH